MSSFIALHQKLHRWQQQRWAKILLTTCLTIGIIATLAPLLLSSYTLHQHRADLYSLLTGSEQHIAALQLEETGFVEVRGDLFGDERLKGFKILDENDRVIDPAGLTSIILRNEVPRWIPTWLLQDPTMTIVIGVIGITWCAIAVWLSLFPTLLYASVVALIGWYYFHWIDSPNAANAIVGMCLLGFSFHLLISLIRVLFGSARAVPALARGVMLEASRTRLSLTFVTLLLLILPLIPVLLDPESPLRHQVQTLLSRSLGSTFIIAAFLTVFLGCGTVAFEIRDRQIWQVLTKPVSRFGYLLGKWIGIISLNLVILAIAGISIFMYLQYLRTAPVASGIEGDLDRLAVEEEVLTARIDAQPIFDTLTNEQLSARVDQLIEADPELRNVEQIQVQLRKKLRQDIQEQFLALQRSIPPTQDGAAYSQTYQFEGLNHARKLGTPLAFKYRFHIGSSDEHETFKAGLIYNDDPSTRHVVTYVPTMTHVTMIPAYMINDKGVLRITIYNLYEPPPQYPGLGTMHFDKGGIELLYRAGDFEGNFLRAIIVLWVKLAFLAALALCASTFLSFPVACMASLTIFACGTLAPFLSDSLLAYAPPPTSAVDFKNIAQILQWAFENTVRGIASSMVFLLDGFGSQRPTDQLVEGTLVSWSSVLRGVLTIGVLWSGISLAIGTLVLNKRQLAIYSGSG